MKTPFFLTLVIVIGLSVKGYSQVSFGVSPGIGLNTAYIGYKVNDNVVPFFGFQYLNASFKYEQSGRDYDWELNRVVNQEYSEKLSGSLYIPNIGLKYFIAQKNQMKPYISVVLSKPFLSAKAEDDGEEIDDVKDAVKKLKMIGGELAFGTEYFFDDNFSIGGEFGLRYFHFKYDDSYDHEYYNPNTGDYEESEIEVEYRFNTSPTFTKISLNYYF
ncbi:MAG: hypothetical protein JXB49_14995 [Bacteroidales bacterium]|nr:hypothetical protein [Bacteroidales bacterium]